MFCVQILVALQNFASSPTTKPLRDLNDLFL